MLNSSVSTSKELNLVNRNLKFLDYKDKLKTTIKFEKNKYIPFHGWYPFVEGFSEEFINGILEEVNFKEVYCLEPFSGSGTTPLTLQNKNMTCYSYEVSPFMFMLSRVKLRTDYTNNGFFQALACLEKSIKEAYKHESGLLKPPAMSSMVDNGKRQKWLFHDEAMLGILDIKYAISTLNDKKYKDLFKIALSSILLEVSNVYRNGKTVSYKKDWENIYISRKMVHELLYKQLNERFLPDIISLQTSKRISGRLFTNYKNCSHGDVRLKINECPNDFFNLVITSPPYLNSRDYTDTYMVELWALDFVKSYESVKKLRESTIRSHVQVKWNSETILEIAELRTAYNNILEHKNEFWNGSIPDMISGYFADMDTLFSKIYLKMVKGGKIYFNVANSAYYGVHIPTDIIISQIAERNGFYVDEIRIARHITPSSQQKDLIQSLRESVIVLTK